MLNEARAAFSEGRAQMAEGRYREAIVKFRQAAQVKETPGLRYYIAYCLEQLDELLEAKAEYDRAAELLKDFEAGDVRELLPEARARVDRALASLRIEGVPADDQVFVDGNGVQIGSTIFLNPGSHEVVVKTASGTSSRATVELSRGESRKFAPEAPARAAPPMPDAAPPPQSQGNDEAKKILFWTSVGVAALGAGALGTGLILREDFANQAISLKSELVDSQGTPNPCASDGPMPLPDGCSELASDVSAYETFDAVAIAGGIGLGVGVSSALLIHFLWPDAPKKVEAALSPQSFGLTVRTQF
jgi:tetratricopeptide (TPR) repeat protein